MSDALDLSPDHNCFLCSRQVNDMEPHIHITLDEWSIKNGLEPTGVDIEMVVCADCTEESEDGWAQEAHLIEEEEE